jgi:hypothetical protein
MNNDLNNDGVIDEDEMEIVKERWETKRKIVWLCTFGMFLFGFLITGVAFTDISPEKFAVLGEMFGWIFFGFTSVIGAYFGFSAYSAKVK